MVTNNRQQTTEMRVREVVARELCALVYRYGRDGKRFEMPLDQLHREIGLGPLDIDSVLDLAEQRDWVRRSRSKVALRATGIFVAKRVLFLDAGDE